MRRTLSGIVAVLCLVPGSATAGGGGDPLLAEQWNLELINAPEAWQTARGDGALIAILDGAVDVGHPDLRANVAGRGFSALTGRSGTGAADDHGTFVAGIAAAAGDNGEGISGVAPDARILPVTACKSSECPATAIADGIRYATRRGADVINLSLYVAVVDEDLGDVIDAIRDARARGVVVVAAAGNNREPWCVEPAASVICVGAIGRSGLLTTYANGDAAMQSEYLVAPGGDVDDCDSMIVSTSPPSAQRACPAGKHYMRRFGTSAAAPHVAGVAALLAGMGADFGTVEHCILHSATDLGPPRPRSGVRLRPTGRRCGCGVRRRVAIPRRPLVLVAFRRSPWAPTSPRSSKATETLRLPAGGEPSTRNLRLCDGPPARGRAV